MKNIWSRGFGKLHCNAEMITDDKGKTFLLATVEFDNRILNNGRPYAQRVVFRSFDPQDWELLEQLTAGTYIMFDGETDAVSDKSQTGWWYANVRVTGRINEIVQPIPSYAD